MSALGLGFDGDTDHRLGEVHLLEHDRVVRSASACPPVFVAFRPTMAQMSPARTVSTSSRELACMKSKRPARSFFSLVAVEEGVALFERARIDTGERDPAHIGGRSRS